MANSVSQRFPVGLKIVVALTFAITAVILTAWISNRPGYAYGRSAAQRAVRNLRTLLIMAPSSKYNSSGIRHPASPYRFPALHSVGDACRKLGEDHEICDDLRTAYERASQYESNPSPELKEVVDRQLDLIDSKLSLE